MTPLLDLLRPNSYSWQKTRQVTSIQLDNQVLKRTNDVVYGSYSNNHINISINLERKSSFWTHIHMTPEWFPEYYYSNSAHQTIEVIKQEIRLKTTFAPW